MRYGTWIAFVLLVLGFVAFATVMDSLGANKSQQETITKTVDDSSIDLENNYQSTNPTIEKNISEPVNTPTQINISDLELEIHNRINDIRSEYSLGLVSYDSTLATIARQHSIDMATRDYFDHIDPDGLDPSDRGKMYGYEVCGELDTGDHSFKTKYNYLNNRVFLDGITENIASVTGSTLDDSVNFVVNGWMNSPSHRENILMPYVTSEGIGVYQSENGEIFVTENMC